MYGQGFDKFLRRRFIFIGSKPVLNLPFEYGNVLFDLADRRVCIESGIALDVLPVFIRRDQIEVICIYLAFGKGACLLGQHRKYLATLNNKHTLELINKTRMGWKKGHELLDFRTDNLEKFGLLHQEVTDCLPLGFIFLEQMLLNELLDTFIINDKVVEALPDAVHIVRNMVEARIVEEQFLNSRHEREP